MIDQSCIEKYKIEYIPLDEVEEYVPLDTVKGRRSFAHELISMSDRFKLYDTIYEVNVSIPFVDKKTTYKRQFGFVGEVYKAVYIPTKNGIIMPTCMPTIDHEIAHIVEMNDITRIVKPDLGLNMGFKNSESHSEFFCVVAREAKVRAIQTSMGYKPIRIKDHGGFDVQAHLPYGRFQSYKNFLEWEEHLHTSTVKAWGKDRVMSEWKTRLDYIHNWMETK